MEVANDEAELEDRCRLGAYELPVALARISPTRPFVGGAVDSNGFCLVSEGPGVDGVGDGGCGDRLRVMSESPWLNLAERRPPDGRKPSCTGISRSELESSA